MAEVICLETERRSRKAGTELTPFRHWCEGRAVRDQLDAQEQLAWFKFRFAQEDHGEDSPQARHAYEAYRGYFKPRLAATYQLMMTPAPDKKALRWKERASKMGGGCAEWEVAMERDRQRLEAKRKQ